MTDFLTWMKGSKVNPESLHVYNFGYKRSLPLPSLPLTPESQLKFNLQSTGMETPSRWSIVVLILSPFRNFWSSNLWVFVLNAFSWLSFEVFPLLYTNVTTIFPIGFSSNMVLLLWCVCGGFLLHILECNYLTVLVKPVYEKPVDTAEDVIERGLTIITNPDSGSLVETAKKSPFESVRQMAELSYVSTVFI